MVDSRQRTSRTAGCVGRFALVPQYVVSLLVPNTREQYILDFGCGKHMMHVEWMNDELRSEFEINVDAFGYDLWPNDDPKYLNPPLPPIGIGRWDIIYLSNVLNVQETIEQLEETIRQVRSISSRGTLIVFNYPKTPRKLPSVSEDAVVEMFIEIFEEGVTTRRWRSGKIHYIQM